MNVAPSRVRELKRVLLLIGMMIIVAPSRVRELKLVDIQYVQTSDSRTFTGA